ncbi:MAG: hypothetical protein J5803_04000 [Desulfovibrio sp.]|nr:hypothetical protein [Desulfovibrio sp.]
MKNVLAFTLSIFIVCTAAIASASPAGDFFFGIEPGDSLDAVFDKLSNTRIIKEKQIIIAADLPEGTTDPDTGVEFVLVRSKADVPPNFESLSLIAYPPQFKDDGDKQAYYEMAYSTQSLLSFKFKNKILTGYGFFEMPDYFKGHTSLANYDSFIRFFGLTKNDYEIVKDENAGKIFKFRKDYGSYTFKGQLFHYDDGYSLFDTSVDEKKPVGK